MAGEAAQKQPRRQWASSVNLIIPSSSQSTYYAQAPGIQEPLTGRLHFLVGSLRSGLLLCPEVDY